MSMQIQMALNGVEQKIRASITAGDTLFCHAILNDAIEDIHKVQDVLAELDDMMKQTLETMRQVEGAVDILIDAGKL